MTLNYKRLAALLLAALMILSVGCSQPETPAADSGKVTVVTTLFPLYDFSKTLLGSAGDVSLLLPPGVEPHAYEPTPRDIVRISKADVFIYTGEAMEPWVHQMLEGIENPNLIVIDASAGIDLQDGEPHDHEEGAEAEAGEDHDHEGKDPHIWLDPVLAEQMAATIADGLCKAAPDQTQAIDAAEAALHQQLVALDQACAAAFEKTQYNEIVYGGHFAFGYFARRYGLVHVSPYEGFSPDAEPTPAKIAALIAALKHSGTQTVFYEELIDPKVAQVIADETGAQMLMLHGAHNVTKEEMAAGITYVEIMERNLENLKKGLGYRE